MHSIQRRFNFTGRVDLDATSVSVRVSAEGDGTTSAFLEKIELPSQTVHAAAVWREADVVLEAVRMSTTSYKRVTIGALKDVLAGSFEKQVDLSEFDGSSGILFRVKVVARDDKRLLAAADRIQAVGETPPPDRDELIKVQAEDLGELTWRIDWDDAEQVGPIVKVNSGLLDPHDYLKRDPALTGAIVPQIFREVLYRICLEKHLREYDWCKHWIRTASRIHDEPMPDDVDYSDRFLSADLWVREVITKFALEFSMTSATNEFLGGSAGAQ